MDISKLTPEQLGQLCTVRFRNAGSEPIYHPSFSGGMLEPGECEVLPPTLAEAAAMRMAQIDLAHVVSIEHLTLDELDEYNTLTD